MHAKIKNNIYSNYFSEYEVSYQTTPSLFIYGIQNVLRDTVKHNEGCLQKRFPQINYNEDIDSDF